MSDISAALVKQLRDMTDAGMMDCKKALVAMQGDLQKAVEFLREKGLSKAASKADRIAAEGMISVKVAEDFSQACMLEINSETDFVAKNDSFKDFVMTTNALVFTHHINDVSALDALNIGAQSFDEYRKTQIATIGENIVVRRSCSIKAQEISTPSTTHSIINAYVHSNHRVGVIIALSSKQEHTQQLAELAYQLCMHAAAMKPIHIDYHGFSAEFLEKERVALIAEIEKDNEEARRLGKPQKTIPTYISRAQITQDILDKQEQALKAELQKQGKPESIWDRILPGQLERFIADNTLLDQRLTLLGQFFIMDEKKTIAQVLADASNTLHDDITITHYVRFELGEGIEKKKEDFAAEVAAQMR